MFGADTDALFSSVEVIYLVIADLFFAAYVVSISILGADEDSVHLTLSQMLGGVVLSLVGWLIESALGHGSFSLPTDMKFWISALFIGVLIRAVYGILQMICQKHVPAINASLIFSAEIIITLILNPFMSRLLGADYSPATAYQVIGCVAMDVLMSDLNESMVNDGIIDPNVATMLDNAGNVIASKYLDADNDDSLNIYEDFEGNQLKDVADTILANTKGIIKTGEGDDATYVSYATIHSTDWTIGIVSPVYSVLEPANAIRSSIDENTATVIATVVQGIMRVLQDCLILMAVILLAATFIIGKSSRKITDPLKKLEADVQEISRGNLDYRSDVKTDDEIGSLANSFNFMTDSIQQYMSDLKDATAKEERIASELSVATNIQADMLPSDFPAFPEHKEFDIFATMNPAKEVGGDFYDFFLIDDKHLGLVMADVSGKGVPAALFMVIAKTMIKNRALMGGTPGEILADVNNQLCEGNKESLFVTVWLAIVDLTTGVVTETNAGHEYPAIRHKDGSFELRKTKHSPAVAVMEDFPFRDGEFQLQPGDRLFVYTDGCPEATNAFDTLFGNDRMIESLNKHKDETLPDLLHGLREDIDAFVGEAPQFDDVTMLGFDFFGPQA